MKQLIAIAFSAVLLAACSSNTPVKDAPIVDASGGVKNDGGAGADPNKVIPLDVSKQTGDTPPEIARRSIYFDLDSYVVKDEYRPTVEANAAFLKRLQQRKVIIQGNTDERGSREYNLALGQKRAEAVKSMLKVMGVGEGQLEAVSFGEDKPQDPGHDESAYSKNRRADFYYP